MLEEPRSPLETFQLTRPRDPPLPIMLGEELPSFLGAICIDPGRLCLS